VPATSGSLTSTTSDPAGTGRSWCRSDLGRDQGSETATLLSGKP
jgi:hypothetical protein